MTLAEYTRWVLSSKVEDWTAITCWGAGSGPSFRDRIIVWNTVNDELSNIEVDSHSNVASLKSNLSISIAWGIKHNDNFVEKWTKQFADSNASSSFLDFYYNGALILREVYVSVDGGRCALPLPDRQFSKEDSERESLTVERSRITLFRLINALMSTHDFDSYLNRSGIQVIDKEWP